jgi:Flp pilus assembly protein TadB
MDLPQVSAGPLYTMGLVSSFVCFCLLASGVIVLVIQPLLWRRHMQRRLQGRGRDRLARIQILRDVHALEGSPVMALAQKLGAWGKVENLQRRLLQADIFWHPGTFLSLAGLLACTGFLLAHLYLDYWVGFAVFLVCGYVPFFIIRIKRNRKTRITEKQMPRPWNSWPAPCEPAMLSLPPLNWPARRSPAPWGAN